MLEVVLAEGRNVNTDNLATRRARDFVAKGRMKTRAGIRGWLDFVFGKESTIVMDGECVKIFVSQTRRKPVLRDLYQCTVVFRHLD